VSSIIEFLTSETEGDGSLSEQITYNILKFRYESRKRISRSLTTNKESELVHEEVRKKKSLEIMLLFIRLAVEEGRTLQHIHFVIHLFCNRRQLPESLPAFSISTKKKGKKGVGER
jgi:hypothetical protein